MSSKEQMYLLKITAATEQYIVKMSREGYSIISNNAETTKSSSTDLFCIFLKGLVINKLLPTGNLCNDQGTS